MKLVYTRAGDKWLEMDIADIKVRLNDEWRAAGELTESEGESLLALPMPDDMMAVLRAIRDDIGND